MDIRTPNVNLPVRTHDLGRFDTAVLLCGGAYSNLEALSALFDAARKMDIPPERIIHSGDAVAYCADPAQTAQMLSKSGAHAIQGNVEESLAASLPDCGCGFDEGSACDQLAAEWFAYADAMVGDDLRRWMAKLPHQLTFEMAGKSVRVIHGSISSINRFMFESLPDRDFESELTLAAEDVIVAGHSGIPFTRLQGGRVWHNCGSLGLPANDGTARSWYSVLVPDSDTIAIRHMALDYDHRRAAEKMIAAGVALEYADALMTGLWPSLDILPERERQAAGKPLHFEGDALQRAVAASA